MLNSHSFPLPMSEQKGWPWGTEQSPRPVVMLDGKPWPKISVVTPNYNYGHFLEKTIRSVVLQGYPNLEYIVIDGGSMDNSVEIIKQYEPWISYWESEHDCGQSHAINKGLAKTSGDILTWLNSDDFFMENTLFDVAEAFALHPDAGAICGSCLVVDVNDVELKVVHPPGLEFVDILNWYQYLPQPSCFFSGKAWHACGPLDESLHIQMDYALWLAIAKQFTMIPLPTLLSGVTIHADAKTMDEKNRADSKAERWIVMMKFDPEHAKNKMRGFVNASLKSRDMLDVASGRKLFRSIVGAISKLLPKAK